MFHLLLRPGCRRNRNGGLILKNRNQRNLVGLIALGIGTSAVFLFIQWKWAMFGLRDMPALLILAFAVFWYYCFRQARKSGKLPKGALAEYFYFLYGIRYEKKEDEIKTKKEK